MWRNLKNPFGFPSSHAVVRQTFSTPVPCCCWSFGSKITAEIDWTRGLWTAPPSEGFVSAREKARRRAWNICQEARFPPRWLFCLSTVDNQSRQRCMEGAGTFCSLCRENGDLLVVFISVEWPEHTLTTWGGGWWGRSLHRRPPASRWKTAKVSLRLRKKRFL